MPTAEDLRERMREGFLPDPNIQPDHRATHALEYIAFYLGEISRWGEDIHIACAMMSAAPMAHTMRSEPACAAPPPPLYAPLEPGWRAHIKRSPVRNGEVNR